MSLKLWVILSLAGPFLLIILAQVLVIYVFVTQVVFKILGKNYEAAVMCAGYAGLALGATPTAVANMTAITQKLGAAPKAFIVIPLIGAFFVDLSNAVIINIFLKLLA